MKKYLLLTIAFLISLLCVPLKSQNYVIHWRKGPSFPLPLSEIKAITLNDKIYVLGGKIVNSTTDFSKNENVDFTYEFNPVNKKWTKKANIPFKEYDLALGLINDEIYAIGSKTAKYNPDKDTWQMLKTLSDGKAHLESAVVKGKIYIVGFFECLNPGKTMRYDPQTDTWTEVSPIPFARIAPTVAVVENKIYVMGGTGLKENGRVDFSKQLQRIDVYDSKNNTWKTKKPMPDSLRGAEGVIVKDNNIFLINVRSNKKHVKHNIYIYNPKLEEWSVVKENLPQSFGELGITLLNNEIYVIGGQDNKSVQHDDVYIGTIEKLR